MTGERGGSGAAVRETLLAEVRRGLMLLGGLLAGSQELLGLRSSERVSGARAEVSRMIERREVTIAVVGERASYELLDAWLGSPLLADVDARGFGPVITLRRGPPLAYRVLTRAGGQEERREPAAAPAEPPPSGWIAALRRLWLRIRSIFSRAPALPPGSGNGSALVRELRALLAREGGEQVAALQITSPTADLEPDAVIVDLRGASLAGASELPRDTDACLLVLEGAGPPGPGLRELAATLAGSFSHVLVTAPGDPSAEDVARVLGLDSARLCPWSRARGGLSELAQNERALGAGARCAAAIKLAMSALNDALARDADVDQRAIELLASQRIEDVPAWKDAALGRLAGGCAGRTVKILKSTASVLEEEIARLEAECTSAVDSAESRPRIQEHVATVDPALRAMRDTVERRAAALAERACAELLPGLRAELESRVDAVAAHTERTLPRPAWPPLRRLDPVAEPLLASETLGREHLLRVDMKWSDALLLRSLDSIKERSKTQLSEALQQLGRAAWTEILQSEPHVAQVLLRELGAWLDAAVDELSRWLEAVVEAEREVRDAARESKHAAAIEARDRLSACLSRINGGARAVSGLSRRLCSAEP